LQTAVKGSPRNPTYHYHFGLANQKTGDYAHAREQLERALELHPTASQADLIHMALACACSTKRARTNKD
jgi:regulator of sirC expression with transglutaminase-like and TPR domain